MKQYLYGSFYNVSLGHRRNVLCILACVQNWLLYYCARDIWTTCPNYLKKNSKWTKCSMHSKIHKSDSSNLNFGSRDLNKMHASGFYLPPITLLWMDGCAFKSRHLSFQLYSLEEPGYFFLNITLYLFERIKSYTHRMAWGGEILGSIFIFGWTILWGI